MTLTDHTAPFVSRWSAVIGAFRSAIFRREVVPSGVRCCTSLLLCFLTMGIQASGISDAGVGSTLVPSKRIPCVITFVDYKRKDVQGLLQAWAGLGFSSRTQFSQMNAIQRFSFCYDLAHTIIKRFVLSSI